MIPRRPRLPRSLLFFLVVVVAGCGREAKQSDVAPGRTPVVGRALVTALAAEAPGNAVRVIIAFREDAALAKADPPARREAILKLQQALSAREIPGLTVTHRYEHVAALAGTVTREALERLGADPTIASIELDEQGQGH